MLNIDGVYLNVNKMYNKFSTYISDIVLTRTPQHDCCEIFFMIHLKTYKAYNGRCMTIN